MGWRGCQPKGFILTVERAALNSALSFSFGDQHTNGALPQLVLRSCVLSAHDFADRPAMVVLSRPGLACAEAMAEKSTPTQSSCNDETIGW
jgi:hypothetical protein